MKEGKQKCRILKEIRRQIAEANDIELITSECKYRGDCLGTCPKCEAEVHYLEQQLLFRVRMGLAIKIVGVSLGMSAMGATSLNGQQVGEDRLKNDSNILPQVEVMGNRVVRRCTVVAGGVVIKKVKAVTVKGTVVDKYGHPIIGAEIIERGANHKTYSDLNGRFMLQVSGKRPVLEVSLSGMKTKEVRVRKRKAGKIKVVLHKNSL